MTDPWDAPKQIPCEMCDSKLIIDGTEQLMPGPCPLCRGTKLMPLDHLTGLAHAMIL